MSKADTRLSKELSIEAMLKKANMFDVDTACLYLYLFCPPKLMTAKNKLVVEAFQKTLFGVKPERKP